MEDLEKLISNLVNVLKDEIKELYKIYESYLTDLILSKNINISISIDSCVEKDATNNILFIIAAANSALITIGVPKSKLTADHNLYQEFYEQKKSQYTNFLSFLQLGLKEYINKHLFTIILEYLIENNDKIIENLDLFDLLPYDFRNKLNRFKNTSNLSEKEKNLLEIFSNDLLTYFNPSTLTFKVDHLQIEAPVESLSETNILEELQKARQDNIDAIAHTSKHINGELPLKTTESPSLLNYFVKFPKLNQAITNKININIKQLRKFIVSSPEFLDLENLYYAINIFKMLGEELQVEPGYVENIVSNFISGKVFSTGRYHKPSPISIYHGLSVLSELDILNSSELVDLLDIEMFLENELNPFIPEKLSLNFFTLLSLKLLKKSGGIITDKSHLIDPLIKLDLFNLEGLKSSDLFYYLGSLKLVDNRFDFTNLHDPYLTLLEEKKLPDGSFNGSTTETARILLTLVLLNSTGENVSFISDLLKFLNQNLTFFKENQGFDDFVCFNNKIAFKIELRMLFWMLVALSQYF